MSTTTPRGLLAPLAATLVNMLLLAAALLYPVPFRVDVGAPGDAYGVASFHRPEGSFRWSAPGSALLIPAGYDGPLKLGLRLHAAPSAEEGARTLRLERDGATVAALATTPDWRVYRLLLPPDAAPEPAGARVERLALAAAPTLAPGDARPLGVALDEATVGSADPAGWPPGGTPTLAALGSAAPVAWAAGLLLLTVALTLGVRHPTATALLMLLAGAGLAAWAWLHPLGFAWSVPRPPWWLLGVGTLALGLGLWAQRGGQSVAWHRLPLALTGWPVAAAALPLGLLALALPPPWSGAGALALALLPGALGAWALFPEERAPATRAMLGACGAVAGAALLMLALDALPGAPPGWLLTGALVALSVGLSVALRQNAAHLPPEQAAAPARDGWPGALALALVAGAGLRLWALGAAEFQGDEARAMLLALGSAQGEDGLLLSHTKGPVEALLPATVITATGAISEWAARLPFALASLGVLAGALALTRELADNERSAPGGANDGPAALVAISLLAVDGFAVAFGRIVQYQSVVMLMMLGAFWACWRFYQGVERGWRHLLAAAALLAAGLLAHYDAVYVALALAWLVGAGGLRRGWRPADWARGLAAPALLGAALLASFYVPYVTAPGFGATAAYLAGRAGQGDAGGPPFNNLPLYSHILAFYNAPPLAPLLVATVALSLVALIARHVKPRALGAALAAGLAAATLAQWLVPGAFTLPGGASWAGLAFGLPLLGLGALPGAPGRVRAPALWFAVALGAQAFVIAEPRTHFYTAHVPAALLVGLAISGAQRAPGAPGAQAGAWAAALLTTTLLVGGGAYGALVFLRQLPEYQRAYPAARPGWLRGPYGDTLPEAGYFGFPHRDGWKAAAELLRAGELQGSYASNQNRWLVGWYLGGLAQACTGEPDLYLIAEGEPTVYYPPGRALAAEVTVGPGRALAIYGREPPDGAARSYALEELGAAFDGRRLPARDAGAILNTAPPRCE